VTLGIEPLDRGTLLHRVLASVWGELQDQAALTSLSAAELTARVRAITERHAAQSLQPSSRYRHRLAALEIDSTVRQVCRLLAIERGRAPFAVRFAEAAEPYVIGGLAIRLQPDRIDQLGGGGYLLIDYKLGESYTPRQWLDVWPSRPRRPQLPLYALAHADNLSALAFVILAPGATEYRGWSDGADVAPGVVPYPKRARLKSWHPPDWPTLLPHWHATLTQLAQQYVAGEAAVDPLPHECSTCHLSTLCRIHERVVESPPDPEGEATRDEDE
jgi:ATP-dependent helicase/nuclease subunit B